MSSDQNTDFHQFIADVKQHVRQAQHQAPKSVNKEQTQLYRDLGQLIVDRQTQHGWGKSVVEQLATEL